MVIVLDNKIKQHIEEDLRGILTEQFGSNFSTFNVDYKGGYPFLVYAHLKDGKTARLSYELNAELREKANENDSGNQN